jgi:hypothetical protein
VESFWIIVFSTELKSGPEVLSLDFNQVNRVFEGEDGKDVGQIDAAYNLKEYY